MIDNIGIDIIENDRIIKSISDSFIDMILTEEEKKMYENKKGKKKNEYLCGRYACKEAIIKAVNEYENPHFKEITILNKKNGAPYAIFKDYKLLVTISHEINYTVAEAILLK